MAAPNGTSASSGYAAAQRSRMNVEYRTNRSIPMFVLHHLIRPFATKLITAKQVLPAGSPQLEPDRKAKNKCDIKEHRLEDIYLYELRPRSRSHQSTEKTKKKKRLYYFAGGGWQMPASSGHWSICADMANEVPGTAVVLVSYPLAPNSRAPAAFPAMMKLYRRILHEAAEAGEDVILAGDSAGGNIVLCLVLAALSDDFDLPAPKALVVISPSCDLSRKNLDIITVQKHDPILRIPFVKGTADSWRGEWDAHDPRVSPLEGDVRLLARKGVELHGVVGRYDILSPDVLLFRNKCEEAGVGGNWLDWDKQMHVFPLAYTYKLSESVQAKDWIMDVLRRV